MNRLRRLNIGLAVLIAVFGVMLAACEKPNERIVLRDIRDVLVDANTDPMLRANAVFFNPNDMHGKLKKINVILRLF